MLTRKQFCELTRLAPDTLKTMDNRGQLPLSQPAAGERRQRDSYTELDAFLTFLALEFGGEPDGNALSRFRAGQIVEAARSLISERLYEISETSNYSAPSILVGQLQFPASQPEPFCGTYIELNSRLAVARGHVIHADLLNASAGAAVMKNRARAAKIDISELWN